MSNRPMLGSIGAVVVLLLVSCSAPGRDAPASNQAEAAPSQHLLLIVERAPAGFRVAEAHVVKTPLPTTRVPRDERWRADVLDADGHRLFSVSLPERGVQRGELAGPAGAMQATEHRPETFSFSLRVPVLPGAAHIRFVDTMPDGQPPEDLQAVGGAHVTEKDLGTTPYPKDAR